MSQTLLDYTDAMIVFAFASAMIGLIVFLVQGRDRQKGPRLPTKSASKPRGAP